MKQITYTLGIILVLCSCTKEVDIQIPGYDEQIVIDGTIKTGQPAIILLSTTANIYAPTNLEAYLSGFISGATVVVSNGDVTDTLLEICTDNLPPEIMDLAAEFFGLPAEELINLHLCGYISTSIVGEVDKTYSLNVKVNGETYTSSTSILQPTALDSLYWKPEPSLSDHGWSWAKLSDPPGSFDAYVWEVQRLNTLPDGSKDLTIYKPFGPYFDDAFFDGLTFEFAYENPINFSDEDIDPSLRGYYPQGDTILITLSKIGQAEFNFFEKKYNQMYTAGNPFATPTNIPSNIQGGALGVWAGFSPTVDTLICQP
tara:strand:- start:3987 stop:4928 length:942 start_codon:yes stop_codon:yes gene_type:complete